MHRTVSAISISRKCHRHGPIAVAITDGDSKSGAHPGKVRLFVVQYGIFLYSGRCQHYELYKDLKAHLACITIHLRRDYGLNLRSNYV